MLLILLYGGWVCYMVCEATLGYVSRILAWMLVWHVLDYWVCYGFVWVGSCCGVYEFICGGYRWSSSIIILQCIYERGGVCCVTKRWMSVQDTLGTQGVSLLVLAGLFCFVLFSLLFSLCVSFFLFIIIIFESVDLRSFFRPILSI